MTKGVVAALLVAVIVAGAAGAYAGLRSGPESSVPPAPVAPRETSTATPRATAKATRTPRPKPSGPKPWVQRAALDGDVRRVAARGAVGVALRPLDAGAVVQVGSVR